MRAFTTTALVWTFAAALVLGAAPHTAADSPKMPPATDGSPDWLSQAQASISAMEYDITWADCTWADANETAAGALPDTGAGSTAAAEPGSCYQAPNRALGTRFFFTGDAVVAAPAGPHEPSWSWSMAWTRIARGRVEQALGRQGIDVESGQATVHRGGIVEHHTNSARGLVTSAVLNDPPPSQDRTEPLRLELTFRGDMTIHAAGARELELRSNHGPFLQWGQLSATDSSGDRLETRLEAGDEAGVFIVIVDDRDAVYPLSVTATTSIPSGVSWMAGGSTVFEDFGWSVATAGDVNGDGYSDVVIGAPGFSAVGAVFVYYGSPTGLPPGPSWTVVGQQTGSHLGHSVATAGDVNGDGYADIIVGAPYLNPPGSTVESAGAAWVYAGSPTGLAAAPQWTHYGAEVNFAFFGSSVATAGDVDGDGMSDIIIGSDGWSNTAGSEEGAAYLFRGSASGPQSSAAWTLFGSSASSSLGASVATAGDVNGDTYSDVLIGAPGESYDGYSNNGVVYVFLGSASGLQATADIALFLPLTNQWIGHSASTAGDVNGDGFADILIGGPSAHSADGKALLYFGGPGLGAGLDWFVLGQNGGRMGESVATAGDVNGDGYADIIVGEPQYTASGSPIEQEGRTMLWLGSPSGPNASSPYADSADWKVSSGTAYAWLGRSVATAGDINGDGWSDILASAPHSDWIASGEGIAYAYLGGPDALRAAPAWRYEGAYADSSLGFRVATIGDVNGDGYADYAGGAPYYTSSSTNEGAVYVFYGTPTGLPSTPDWWARGITEGANLGWSLGTAGDVNGDGYSDLIVGAPGFHVNSKATSAATDKVLQSNSTGIALVWLGSASGLGIEGDPTNADWIVAGDQTEAHLGYAVGTAGDINGDGYADIFVSAPTRDHGETDEGSLFVWLGGPAGLGASGTTATADWSEEGDVTGLLLGMSAASAGDINQDGFSDLVAGGLELAVVWLGSISGLRTTGPDWAMTLPSAGSLFGYSVASAGDVNGDGYADVVVGAPYFSNTFTAEGAAWVYCGGPSGLTSSYCWTDQGGADQALMGLSVGCGGDLDGDGRADLVVGAPGWSGRGQVRVYYGSALGPISYNGGDWTAVSSIASAGMGRSVGTAGDVNGDGYADLIVGSPAYTNGQSGEGCISLYYGNGHPGLSYDLQQLGSDGVAPLAPLGRSDAEHEIQTLIRARSSSGRGKYKLQHEIKPTGSLLDGTGLLTTPAWYAGALHGVTISTSLDGLSDGTLYHWRARVVSDPVTNPFDPPRGRWLHMPWNGANEGDARTALDHPAETPLFADTFESGDLSRWSSHSP